MFGRRLPLLLGSYSPRKRHTTKTLNLASIGPYVDFLTTCAGDIHHTVNLIPERPLGACSYELKDSAYRNTSLSLPSWLS